MKKLLIAVAWVAVALCAAAAPTGPHKPASTPARVVQGSQPGAPLFVKVLPPERSAGEISADAADRAEKAQMDRGMLRQTERLADYTFWLAVATGALFLFTAGLFSVAFGQFRDSKKLVDATVRSAEAAAKTVEVAEATAQKQLRAYVHVDIASSNLLGPPYDCTMYVTLRAQNFGPTPAHNVEIEAFATLGEIPEPSQLPPGKMGKGSRGPVAGGESFNFQSMPIKLTLPEFQAVKKHQAAVYVYGQLKYVDIFERPHLTEFRWYCTGADIEEARLAFHSSGNRAT